MDFVNIHTHRKTGGIHILDVSDGKTAAVDELCSWGIHPMSIPEKCVRGAFESIKCDYHIVAIGEAGLDRNSSATVAKQLECFEELIGIAEKEQLPLIIHCVKAFPELLALHKKFTPRQAWIIHGYNNNEEILRELLRHGFYISAGKKIFVEKSNIRRLIGDIPLERLFIETDDSDYCIEAVYREVAMLLNVPLELLKEDVYRNFCKVFNKIG